MTPCYPQRRQRCRILPYKLRQTSRFSRIIRHQSEDWKSVRLGENCGRTWGRELRNEFHKVVRLMELFWQSICPCKFLMNCKIDSDLVDYLMAICFYLNYPHTQKLPYQLSLGECCWKNLSVNKLVILILFVQLGYQLSGLWLVLVQQTLLPLFSPLSSRKYPKLVD